MKLHLKRFATDGDSTIGILRLDGQAAFFTLEDERRAVKVASETRIPAGTYQIHVRNEGGMIKRYRRRFQWHRGMLWLQDVPGFQYIYIHVGNTDGDTAGCILVGYAANMKSIAGGMSIGQSVKAYRRLYETVYDAAEAGDLEIIIEDHDR